jgi:hypothetical protein
MKMKTEPDMRFEIRRAANGWILRANRPSLGSENDAEIVCQEDYDDEIECFADFLRTLNEEFGPSTSRYSPKRIYVRVEPGDKCEDGKGL